MKLATDYIMPGANRLALTSQLADEIRTHFKIDRENRCQLYVLAAGLRKQHLTRKGPKSFDDGQSGTWEICSCFCECFVYETKSEQKRASKICEITSI